MVVTPSQLSELRQTIKALRVNGSRRVHMAKDSRHASRLVPAFAGLGLSVRIYIAKLSEASQRYARDQILAALVLDLVRDRVGRLCIESCDQDKQDRIVIRNALVDEFGGSDSLTYPVVLHIASDDHRTHPRRARPHRGSRAAFPASTCGFAAAGRPVGGGHP